MRALLVLALVASALAVTTTWRGPLPSSSWFEPANWDNGVPTAADDAVVVGQGGGFVITVPGNAVARSLTVSSSQTSQVFVSPTLAVSGSLTLGAGGLIYHAQSGTFFTILLDQNTALRVNGPLVTTISPGSADASFVIIANATGTTCSFDSMNLNGGSALSIGGLITECAIRYNITTNGRIVKLDRRYVPEPPSGTFYFFGNQAPYLLGSPP